MRLLPPLLPAAAIVVASSALVSLATPAAGDAMASVHIAASVVASASTPLPLKLLLLLLLMLLLLLGMWNLMLLLCVLLLLHACRCCR